jgi:hypothetical protein
MKLATELKVAEVEEAAAESGAFVLVSCLHDKIRSYKISLNKGTDMDG